MMNDFYTPSVFNSFNPLEESRPQQYSSPIVESLAFGLVAGVAVLAKVAIDKKIKEVTNAGGTEVIDPSRVEVVDNLPAINSRLDEFQAALTKQQEQLLTTIGQVVEKQNESIKALDERLTLIEQALNNQNQKGGKK